MGLQGELKPSRSEAGEILSEDERAMYAKQVKEFLKATAPVRPLKPSRSDLDDALLNSDSAVPLDFCKAELERFKKLEASGELLETEGGTVNDDTYVETLYYDDLNAVDKSLHHQTGSGFIATEKSVCFTVGEDGEKIFQTSNKTNPACNDWQPAPPKMDVLVESKVHRSESS